MLNHETSYVQTFNRLFNAPPPLLDCSVNVLYTYVTVYCDPGLTLCRFMYNSLQCKPANRQSPSIKQQHHQDYCPKTSIHEIPIIHPDMRGGRIETNDNGVVEGVGGEEGFGLENLIQTGRSSWSVRRVTDRRC